MRNFKNSAWKTLRTDVESSYKDIFCFIIEVAHKYLYKTHSLNKNKKNLNLLLDKSFCNPGNIKNIRS